MKKILLLLFFSAYLSIAGYSQATGYSFSQAVDTYTAITGGTVLRDGTSAMDSWVSGAITIPSFSFCNVAYTTAYVTSNGFITLGGTAPSSSTTTAISTNTGSGIAIAPMSCDLNRVNSTAASEIRWETVGNEVIFQWTQICRYGKTENFDFQARLNTSTGVVKFIYRLNSGPAESNAYQPQVGIRTSTTDFKNRKVTSAENWATSLAGTVNTDICRFDGTAPATNFTTGLTYTFTPPPPCTTPVNQPTVLLLTPASASVSGSFTAAVGADSYLVVRGPNSTLSANPVDGTTYATGATLGDGTVVQSGANATFTASGLTAGTQYHFFIFSMNSICSAGPKYLTTSPLTGATTTLPADPTAFTAIAASNTQINLAATANGAGNDIIVAWNSTATFGTPTGTLNVGDPITGGGTVLYKGSAAGLTSHTGLAHLTQYFYKAWTVVGTIYSAPGLTANATTEPYITYLQNFDASTSLPLFWSGIFSVSASHGTGSPTTNGLYKNLYSSITSADAIAPRVWLSANPCRVSFDYRIVNYSGYPGTATTLTTTDSVNVYVSTDNGVTYTRIYSINSTNHVTSTSFANKAINLPVGNNAKIKIQAKWGAGDYYVDIDNFTIEEIPAMPVFSMVPDSKNFMYCVTGTSSAPQTFTISNTGVGTLTIAAGGITLIGTNADQFTLTDNNTYPINLTAGQSATVTVVFTPASTGAKTAQLKVVANAKTNHTADLSGTALPSGSLFESFEGATFPPAGWAVDASTWTTSTTYAFDGTKSAYYYPTTTVTNKRLMTPKVTMTGTSTLIYYAKTGSVSGQTIQIQYSPDKVTWTNIGTLVALTTTWTQYSIDLSSLAGNNYYLAFAATTGSSYVNFYVDYVMGPAIYLEAPGCATNVSPADMATGVSPNPNLTWAAGATGGVPTGYKLYLGTDNPPTNIVNGTDIGNVTTYAAGPLAFSTIYYWKIVPYNTLGDATGCPVWSFTTVAPYTLPFTETFESTTALPGGWSSWQSSGTGNSWTAYTGGVTSGCAYSGYYGTIWLKSNAITVPAGASLDITFYQKNTYPTDYLTHGLYYSTTGSNNLAEWTAVEEDLGVAPASWTLSNTYQISGYVGTTLYLAFKYEGSNADGWYVDNIHMEITPDCSAPTGLTVNNLQTTSANLTWTPGGSETSWQYAYGLNPLAVPTTPGTATTSATTNPIEPLTASTTYDYYVRSNCGGTFSSWAGPYTFTTPCGAASLPYQEHFDLATFPACWTQTSTLSNRWTVSATTSAGGTANEMKATYVSGTGISRLISPPINTSGVAQIGLSFKHLFDTYGTGINYKIQSSADGVTWTDEAWGGASGAANVGPETVNTTVTHNLGGTTYIAWVLDGDHYQFDYWYVDDVSINSLQAGTLQGHVFDPSGEEPIDHATVNVSTFTTETDVNGFYQILNIPVGTYDVTCSKTGYQTGTATGVAVNLNQTTTRNFNLQYQLDPPHGLRAEIQGADNVHLTWQIPADNQYIHWDDGTTAHNIGSSAASSFEAIVRFPVANLSQYDGMYLSAIRFYATTYVANAWELMIYQGENPPTLIYSQPIDAVNAGSWNEIELTTPLQIDGTQELWFGYFVDYNAAMYPAGTDAGPAVAGMNWIYDGVWSLMEDLPLNYNWNIQGWVTNTSGAKMLLSSEKVQQTVVPKQFQGNTRELTAIPVNDADLSNAMKAPKAPNAWTPNGYNIYRDGVKLNTSGWVTNLYYDDLGLAPDTYLYTVKAVYPMGESPQAAGPVEVTILSCPMPTQLGTSEIGTDHAILVWTSQETLFNIEWGPTGFTPGTGTMINGVTSPHTLNSLVANTSYDFYVQTDCGTEDSPFAGPHTFKTLCAVAETPFTEDFEGNLFFPACWSGTTTSPRWQRSIDCSGYGIGTASAIANFYNISSSNPFDLITFEFDASGLNSPQLKFDYAYATYSGELDQMDVYTSTDAGATWNLLLAMPGGETGILNTGGVVSDFFIPLETEWATQTLPLPEGTNMIKFTATSDFGNNLYLDNVIVQATPVPENLTVQNETVSGENCYNATQTITVAGGETTFIVEATGSATFIAGQNILFLPGTKVLAGGYLHGYIAPTGPFCGEAANTMVTKTVEAIEETPAIQSGEFFTVYPNPTNDKFYLELDPSYRDANIIVNIYGMVGGLVQKEQLTGNNRYEFSLSGKNTGVYFIRVMAGDRIDTKKVIKK